MGGSTADPAGHSTADPGSRVLKALKQHWGGGTFTGCLVAAWGSGYHGQLTTVPVAEPRSSLDTLDPSSAEASASNRQSLRLEHGLSF